MNFDEFSKRISKIENLPLPGEDSHYKMAPENRVIELQKLKVDRKMARKAAVLSLFYPDKLQNTNLLLTLRTTYKGVHSNQVSFPGGKAKEEDATLLATALRETHEEVGVLPAHVHVVKKLTEIYIPPSNFEVQPFIGLYENPQPFLKEVNEVEEIVEVSLTDFMDDSVMIDEILTTSYAKNIAVPAFKLNGYTVWGATAMVLHEVKDLLKQVL
ncbi:CoA pyrophosphatase [Cellulophaga baltica]|uniref:NUDIX hydrolase n=1 Tax=Cellulophaga TaxID=104264 RepID=UPI001C07B95C|nr:MULTISPECIES: CoA pyrophosphatase [Cellulophaga]MBU2994914.1 CoA pyrophosphatase [Cellulophaga baltica]MDO6766308.1 CoA pyrophosphatase [Cellulophaga sp. 1_MG-2023]